MKVTSLIALMLTLLGCSSGAETPSADLLIQGARIIDTQAGKALDPADVLIDDGRILQIASNISPAAASRLIDASGSFLLPGLIDVHAHIGDGGLLENTTADRELALKQFLRYGVTTIFVPGGGAGNDEQLNDWKRRCDSGALICPRLYGSGNIITAYGSHPITTIWAMPADVDPAIAHARGATSIRNEEEFDAVLAQKISADVDALKIVVDDGPGPFAPRPRLSSSLVRHICETATKAGLRTYAHVSLADHVDDVVAGGCNGIMHAPDDAISDATLQTMANAGIFYVATLSLFDGFTAIAEGRREQDAYAVAGVSKKALRSLDNDDYWQDSQESPETLEQWQRTLSSNLQRAVELGVRITLGTDTNNPQVFPGHSAHKELQLLVAAGLTPAESLRAATVNAAAFLQRENELGRVSNGYYADLLLLKKNPLEDIQNTTTIQYVFKAGQSVVDIVSVR